jgi:hypothetical protein
MKLQWRERPSVLLRPGSNSTYCLRRRPSCDPPGAGIVIHLGHQLATGRRRDREVHRALGRPLARHSHVAPAKAARRPTTKMGELPRGNSGASRAGGADDDDGHPARPRRVAPSDARRAAPCSPSDSSRTSTPGESSARSECPAPAERRGGQARAGLHRAGAGRPPGQLDPAEQSRCGSERSVRPMLCTSARTAVQQEDEADEADAGRTSTSRRPDEEVVDLLTRREWITLIPPPKRTVPLGGEPVATKYSIRAS